jgi:hypothetical protein
MHNRGAGSGDPAGSSVARVLRQCTAPGTVRMRRSRIPLADTTARVINGESGGRLRTCKRRFFFSSVPAYMHTDAASDEDRPPAPRAKPTDDQQIKRRRPPTSSQVLSPEAPCAAVRTAPAGYSGRVVVVSTIWERCCVRAA